MVQGGQDMENPGCLLAGLPSGGDSLNAASSFLGPTQVEQAGVLGILYLRFHYDLCVNTILYAWKAVIFQVQKN